jgi:SAM-dependent methyltransferase
MTVPGREIEAQDRMSSLYGDDLAFVHFRAFGALAAAAAPAIVARFRRAPIAVRRVIDVGCGAGVTTRILSEAGFETIAVEPSRAFIEMARAAAPRAVFYQATAHAVDLPPCDAVLAVGEPLTYHRPEVDADAVVQRFIGKVASALRPGGLFVFDIISADGPPLDAQGWSSEEDWALLFQTTEDRDAHRLTRVIETFRKVGTAYRRAREVHHVKLFDEDTLRSWLNGAGFLVETARSYGDHPLPPRRVAFFATLADSGPRRQSHIRSRPR